MNKAAIKLQHIQSNLNAPKTLDNKFGGYKYRSAESILEALKPHLEEHVAILTLSDEIVEVGGRVYVKTTATFTSDGESIQVSAFAREAESKKGMDDAQVTGACSSYARKYALNGLFCIDDTKDPDATETHGKSVMDSAIMGKPAIRNEATKPTTSSTDNMIGTIATALRSQTTLSELEAKMDKAKGTPHGSNPLILAAYTETKNKLQ